MRSTPPILSTLAPLRAGAWPPLNRGDVLCVAIAIDWRAPERLHAFAVRHVLPPEQAAAQRYLRREDRLRHLLGRAALRLLAAHYGGSDPRQPMGANRWGKPQPAACTVACNVSHAGDYVLAAAGRTAALGIDVEMAGAPPDARALGAGLHRIERAALARLGHAGPAFMRCWTRKEAVAKATGMGLSLALDAFAVDCAAVAHGWLLVAPPGTARAAWSTLDLPLERTYTGALAVHGCAREVKFAAFDAV